MDLTAILSPTYGGPQVFIGETIGKPKVVATLFLAAVTTLLFMGSAASFANSAAGSQPPPASAPLLGSAHGGALRDRYVVVFDKDAPAGAQRAARDDARAEGARIHYEYRDALRGFAATLPPQALEGLRRNRHVAYIEVDGAVEADDTQSPATWGLDRIDQRNLPLSNSYTYTSSGQAVTAYIIDTGMRFGHTDFAGRGVSGYDAVDGGPADDCNGHGTHVAGTVGGTSHGVAKSVTLVAVRVLNCQGSGTISGVIAGVDWVTANHSAGQAAVANMSLGGGASTALDTAVLNSINDGVTYAVAAGNSNTNACGSSPARVTAAITVGSTTSSDARSSFSNYGSCLDLFAPGSDVTSAWHTTDTATNTISGTSMATPHVAGVAALHLQSNPSSSPSTVRDALVTTATSGVLTAIGTGSPDLLVYSPLTGTMPPAPAGCSLPESYTGTLSGTGDYDIQPNGTYFYGAAGTHRGCLRGAPDTDFDLYLFKWNGRTWKRVARSESWTSSEDITYTGTAAYYRWEVLSHSGSGGYTFEMQRP